MWSVPAWELDSRGHGYGWLVEKRKKKKKRKKERKEERNGAATARVRIWGAVVLVPTRFACRGGGVVAEKGAVEGAMMGRRVWNPGAVFLGSDTTWEQCRGGSVVTERKAVEGLRPVRAGSCFLAFITRVVWWQGAWLAS